MNTITSQDIFDFAQKIISLVQNGNGPTREEIPPELRGRFAVQNWDDPMFTYGIEYGIILGMLNIQEKFKNE